ncbi:aromatase/cyclase [Streptomyces sp. ARC32]
MAQHTEVDAPAGVLYGLIADALRWPVFLPPTVHVEQLEFDGESERLRMWVTANDEIRSWTTRRVLDPVAHRVDFRQEVLPRPVTSMGGSWSVEPRGPSGPSSRCATTFRWTATRAPTSTGSGGPPPPTAAPPSPICAGSPSAGAASTTSSCPSRTRPASTRRSSRCTTSCTVSATGRTRCPAPPASTSPSRHPGCS